MRELAPDERREAVQRMCDRPDVPGRIAADIRAAADRAGAPAAPPPEAHTAARPRAPARTAVSQTQRSTSRNRNVRASTFRGRTLADVPHGTLVEYQGRFGVIEPPWLVLDDGRKFRFPNPAAVYVNGGVEVNGWEVWKVADGRSMAECHDSGRWPPVE